MYHGLLALLTRSLRQDARQLRNHVFRLAFVAFIYLALLFAILTGSLRGAPGLQFFTSITFLNMVFISCAGIGFFATAITEEKEEETIGLLMMAGLNPLGILLGKSTSRLIQSSMLLVVQFPFMLLAVTLGGVTPHQILAMYVALLAFLVLLANVALVWSTLCERGGSAAGLTLLLLGLYTLLPHVAPLAAAELTRTGFAAGTWYGRLLHQSLDVIADSCVYYRFTTIMQTGFNDPVLSWQVLTNLAGGLGAFGLAWVLFAPAMRRASSGTASRGVVLRSSSRLRIFNPGRSWAMPLAWKDFHFVAGGFGVAAIKVNAFVLLLAGLAATQLYASGRLDWNDIATTYVVILFWAVAIEACLLASRIFHDEVRLQTLSSLMMLPRSITYVAYTKALGCLIGLGTTVACIVPGLLLTPEINVARFLERTIDPYAWGILLAFTIFLHLVALLSLFVRWGALPLAIVLMAPISACCPVWQLMFLVVGRGGELDWLGSIAATLTVALLMSLVCFVFQMMISARLQELSGKG